MSNRDVTVSMNDPVELNLIARKQKKSGHRVSFSPASNSNKKKEETTKSAFACRQASVRYLTSPSSQPAPPGTNLDQAVQYGNLQQVKECLESLPEEKKDVVNHIDEKFQLAPLHFAARYGDADLVELLLNHGAEVNLIGDEGKQAIHFTAKFYNKHMERLLKSNKACADRSVEILGAKRQISKRNCLQLLIDNGADVNARDQYQSTPLHYACDKGHIEAVHSLLASKNIALDVFDDQSSTPLHNACGHGHAEIVKKLLAHSPEENINLIKAPDENHATVLILACRNGYSEIAEIILKRANRFQYDGALRRLLDRDLDENTALHASLESGSSATVKLLLRTFDEELKKVENRVEDYLGNFKKYVDLPKGDGFTPLHITADIANSEMLKIICEKEPFLNPTNDNHMTPLYLAAQKNNISSLQYLLEMGCDTEITDSRHLSPLLVACKNGHAQAVEMLMLHGADLRVTDYFSRNCLFLAVQKGNIEVVQSILSSPDRHPLMHETDRFGNTVMHECARHGYLSIMKIFIEIGYSLHCRNDVEQTPLHYAALNNQQETVREIVTLDRSTMSDQDDRSRTALHMAAMKGNKSVVTELIKLGAATGDVDVNLWTPLHMSVSEGRITCVEILLEADHSILKKKTRHKETVLHLACDKDEPDTVKLLLDWNVDVTACLPDGRNALDIAIDRSHEKCAILLIENENWLKCLKNVTFTKDSEWKQSRRIRTPLRKMIESMPEVAELALTKCMKITDGNFSSPSLKITFNYELLEDMYEVNKWKRDSRSKKVEREAARCKPSKYISDIKSYTAEIYGNTTFSLPTFDDKNHMEETIGEMQMKDHQCVGKEDTPYTRNGFDLGFNHPITIMVREKRENLLRHPVVRSLVNYKERKFVNIFYWANSLSFLLYLILLTYYMCTTPPRFALDVRRTMEEVERGADCIRVIPEAVRIWGNRCQERRTVRMASTVVIIAFSAFQLLKEVLRLLHLRLKYFSDIANYFEMALYILSILIFIDFDELARRTGIRLRWQWECGAFAVLLGFLNLCLYLRRTRLGIYIFMIKSVAISFFSFAPVMVIFLLGFSFSFYILLQNQIPFSAPVPAIVKTFVMVIGEFDFERIFFDGFNNTNYENKVHYETSTYVVFLAIVIIMSLMLANLLIPRLNKYGTETKPLYAVSYGIIDFIKSSLMKQAGKERPIFNQPQVGIAVDDIASVFYQASLRQYSVEWAVFTACILTPSSAINFFRVHQSNISTHAFLRGLSKNPMHRLFVEGFLSLEYVFPEIIRRRFVVRWRSYEPNKHRKRNKIYRWFAEERDMDVEYIRKTIGTLEKPDSEKLREELESLRLSIQSLTTNMNNVAGMQDMMHDKIRTMTAKMTQLKSKQP